MNVFEEESGGHAPEYRHPEAKEPSNRKLKAKLKIKDLEIGAKEEERPYKYTKQQSFHFRGHKEHEEEQHYAQPKESMPPPSHQDSSQT